MKTYYKTYYTASINEILNPTLRKLNKNLTNKIARIKAAWKDIAPDWALDLTPYSINQETIIFKAKKNAMIFQYREKEILKIVSIILDETIKKVKIFAN